MNISSEIFPTDGSNSSDHLFYNSTEEEVGIETSALVGIIGFLLGFPTNSYVIWLIVTGTGNGLAAEFFSLNLAFCEILISMQSPLILISYETENAWMVSYFIDGLAMTARHLFPCLICVERYLAVVHPVTFLKYKPLRYRVICSVVVWVACFGSSGVSIITIQLFRYELYFTFFLVQFLLFLSIQLFCYMAVLRALKQSGPGERGREEENHMKRRAFYVILISTVTVVIIYIPFVILIYFMWSSAEKPDFLLTFAYVFFMSSGLVQPLLFLYRVGKLPFINYQ